MQQMEMKKQVNEVNARTAKATADWKARTIAAV